MIARPLDGKKGLAISFLLRIPSSNVSLDQFMDAHNEGFKTAQFAPLGKFGKQIPISARKIISDQKKSGDLTRVFVAMKRNNNLRIACALLEDIIPEFDVRSGIRLPAYYPERPASLFLLSSPLIPSEITGLKIVSTKRDATEALNITRTPMMYVYSGGNQS